MKPLLRGGVVTGILLACFPLAPSLGAASDAFVVYEDWNAPTIRRDRWRGGETSDGQEVVRELVSQPFARHLSMRLRREGETDSNAGARNVRATSSIWRTPRRSARSRPRWG